MSNICVYKQKQQHEQKSPQIHITRVNPTIIAPIPRKSILDFFASSKYVRLALMTKSSKDLKLKVVCSCRLDQPRERNSNPLSTYLFKCKSKFSWYFLIFDSLNTLYLIYSIFSGFPIFILHQNILYAHLNHLDIYLFNLGQDRTNQLYRTLLYETFVNIFCF